MRLCSRWNDLYTEDVECELLSKVELFNAGGSVKDGTCVS